MTGRAPIATETARSPKLGEILESARRALVSVEGAAAGTGWVALANGIVATSLDIVGYRDVVVVGLGDGTKISARVIACDVAYGIAFVLPEGASRLAPLRRAMQPPKLGDGVFALQRFPASELTLMPGIVACAERTIDRRAYWEMSTLVDASGRGGPILDAEGRVVGVIARAKRGAASTLVVPIAAVDRELAALDRPAPQIRDRALVYRCPTCREVFSPEHDRCLGCGVLLPHAQSESRISRSERVAKEILAALGIVANKVRTSTGSWTFTHKVEGGPNENTAVTIRLGDNGSLVTFRAPVVRVPGQGYEAFYRLLLTLNDKTTGAFRLSMDGGTVFLSGGEALASGREREIQRALGELVRHADHYRRALATAYGAEPCFDVGFTIA